MQRFAIFLILTIVLNLSLASASQATEFTIDDRSSLHLGCSAAFGAAADAVFYNTSENSPIQERVLMATIFGQIPGLFKEVAIDGYFDYGDHVFNVLGALSGALLAEYTQSKILGIAYSDGDRLVVGIGGRF